MSNSALMYTKNQREDEQVDWMRRSTTEEEEEYEDIVIIHSAEILNYVFSISFRVGHHREVYGSNALPSISRR